MMDIGSLFLRHLDESGAVYGPLVFHGAGWTEDEVKSISDALAPHVPEKVDAVFNEWHAMKSEGSESVVLWRATWDTSVFRASVSEAAEYFSEYYGRYQ